MLARPVAEELAALVRGRATVVLSGAGISTESGIPDYRSPERLARPRKPMLYQQFVRSEVARRRYWARSLVGWQGMQRARPNDGHRALVRLERLGLLGAVITQNVDGLHQAAGNSEVLELHGSLAEVRCLQCGLREPRSLLQERLLELNSGFVGAASSIAPDGDADLPEELIEDFAIPGCRCGGILKPDVVFFGENVPRQRVADSFAQVANCDVLLVVGSSLTVMSGLRLVNAALDAGKDVAIVNDGATRADDQVRLKVDGRLGQVLPAMVAHLDRPSGE